MKIVDIVKSPGSYSAEYKIVVPMREFLAIHHLEHRPVGERDFAKLIKEYTKRHHRVRWARKAQRKRRALGV